MAREVLSLTRLQGFQAHAYQLSLNYLAVSATRYE